MKFIFHSFNGYLFQMCQVCFNEKKMEFFFLWVFRKHNDLYILIIL